MGVDRLVGEHGIQKDSAAGRREFERRMERRRWEESDGREWKPLQRGWCLGREEFRAKLLERMERRLGGRHAGRLRHESAEAKAGRIIAQELQRLNWEEPDWKEQPKSHPLRPALAARLRRETTPTIRQIAWRLQMGSWKSLNNKLYLRNKMHLRNKTAAQEPGK